MPARRSRAGRACTPTGLLDNLVGYWRLDDGAGSTTAFDSSGRGNEGTLHDLDTATAWVAGRAQGALAIAHTGWVQVAPSPSIDSITDRITVTAWADMEGTIAPLGDGAVAPGRDQQRSALSPLAGPGREADLSPHHQRWVRDAHRPGGGPDGNVDSCGGDLRWRDGAPLRQRHRGGERCDDRHHPRDTTPVILGGNGNDASGVPTELFPGRIDELMLYARALSAAEIAKLAAGALFPAGARDAGAD